MASNDASAISETKRCSAGTEAGRSRSDAVEVPSPFGPVKHKEGYQILSPCHVKLCAFGAVVSGIACQPDRQINVANMLLDQQGALTGRCLYMLFSCCTLHYALF